MTNKEQCLDLIDDIRCTIGCEYIHASILSEIYKYLDEIEKFINQSSSNPTFEQCIKEWNENGFDVDIYALEIIISNHSTVDKEEDEIEISIRLDKKTIFYVNDVELSFDLHHLLSKTLKALEVENEKEN